MKHLILITACIVLFTGVSFSQGESASDVASVTVTVVGAMEVSAEQDLEFGTMVQGNAKDVLSNETGNAAMFRIGATSDVNITVTLTPPGILSGPGADITFTAFDPYRSDDATGSTLTLLNGWVTAGGGTLQTNGNEVYLWLGGGISLAGDQAAGVYSGDYEVAALYTDL